MGRKICCCLVQKVVLFGGRGLGWFQPHRNRHDVTPIFREHFLKISCFFSNKNGDALWVLLGSSKRYRF